MASKRDVTIGLIVSMAALGGLQAGASAGTAVSEAEALEAMNPWADALFAGDPAMVEKVLAPEYQIVRSDGTGFDKAAYLTVLPKQKVRSKFKDIIATAAGDVMVVRYMIETDQTINDQPVQAVSPRLSVFRKVDGSWLISAHANFAKLG